MRVSELILLNLIIDLDYNNNLRFVFMFFVKFRDFLDTTSSNPPSTSVVWDGSVCLSVCSRGLCGFLFLFLRLHNSHSSVISLSAYSNTPLSPARPVSFGCHSFQLWKFLCCCSHLVQTCSRPSVHSPQLSWHLKALSLKASCRSVTRHFCSGLLVHAGFFL